MCVVHLRADKENDDSPVLPSAQRGMKGHVIVHPQRPENLASVLPPAMEDILAPICVIFVGSRIPSRDWLENKAKPLVVRRGYVLAALRWLKSNNFLYKDVEIDQERIKALPTDGLLPYNIQHLQPNETATSVTDRYDVGNADEVYPRPPRESDDNLTDASRQDFTRGEVPFHKVVLTDVDGNAPANQLRAAAIRHVKQKGGGYVEMPHLQQPVNEFFNPSLFPMIYPTLFPYGIGGFEDKARTRPLSLKRHVRHL
ncbi:hypothetical protein FKP32DRAFT_1569157, partial [Trametes sanguinea]